MLYCPVNVVVIQPPPPVSTSVDPTVLLVVVLLAAVLFAVLLGQLVARWLQAGGARRRELAPAVWGGATIVAVTVVQYVAALVGAAPQVQAALAWSTEAVLVGWPVALLLGLLQARLDRAAAGPIVLAAGPAELQAAVATALHDPCAELAFWIPERPGFVDARGAPVEPDPPAAGRTLTPIERDGARLAVVTHACPDHELVAAVVTSVGPAVQNHRLHVAAQARLAEVTASRRRVVEAADAERRRLERNLHDGAQQRLLSVALAVRLARGQLRKGSAADSDELLAEASAELELGLAELRELARGTYPAVLAEAGLGSALRVLADRAPLPVELTGDTRGRLPAPVEHACWFTASELLANAAKHANASRVVVDLRADARHVVLQVHDDGVGGADPAGSGLRGLADRVASAGGVFTVQSPRGAGTTAVATFPAAPRVIPARDPG